MSIDENLLYQLLGDKIRRARERMEPKMSQTALARKLGLSRVSVVNIEAGRQRAPMHVLWVIAEILGTELVLLVPRHDEYDKECMPMKLDQSTVAQIEEAANGDPMTRRSLTDFIGRAKARSQDTR